MPPESGEHCSADESRRNPKRNVWLAILLLLVVAVVCVKLGFWQMHRAHEAEFVIAGFAAAAAAPPLASLPGRASDQVRYRKVALDGHYVPRRQFLIDNVSRHGQPGYAVLTPFAPVDDSRWVIVNRGWVPAPPYRSELPEVPVSADDTHISGRFAALPAIGLKLGEPPADDPDAALTVLLYPEMDELAARLGKRLFAYQIQLAPTAPDGYERKWHAPVVMSPARHWGYAAQWWGFAAIGAGAAGFLLKRKLRGRGA